jgi:hypothetical protein
VAIFEFLDVNAIDLIFEWVRLFLNEFFVGPGVGVLVGSGSLAGWLCWWGLRM